MHSRTLISVLIAVFMLFSTFPTFVQAANPQIDVKADEIKIYQGETTATIEINVTDNPGIALMSFDIGYDSDKMKLISVVAGSNVFASAEVTAGDINNNPYTYLAYTASGNKTGNGMLLKLNFTIDEDCPAGNYPITLTNAEAYTIDENIVDVNLKNGNINVLQKSITGITFANKEYIYDGTEKQIEVKGTLPAGATVEYTSNKATDVGEYDAVALVKAKGYADLTLNAKLTIKPKTLTVNGLSVSNKSYDSTTEAVISGGSLYGKLTGDDVSAVFPTSGVFSDSNVGIGIPVSIGDITLAGADKDNYILTQPAGLKANISKADIFVKADDIIITQGASIPEFTYAITNGKLFGSDVITGKPETATDGKSLGDFNITVGTLSAGSNYNMIFTKGVLKVIDKLSQNIVVEDIPIKTYGDVDFNLNVTKDAVSKLENFTYASDNEYVAVVDNTGKITIKGAGNTVISITEAGNGEFAQTTIRKTLTVEKKLLTVTNVDLDAKTAVLEGVVAKDNVSADLSECRISKNDDSTTVTVMGITLNGDNMNNYILSDAEVCVPYDFAKIITVSISPVTNGIIDGIGDYIIGEEVRVKANSGTGYKFDGWYILKEIVNDDVSDDAEPQYEEILLSNSAEYSFTAEADIELIAKFKKKTTTSFGGGGGATSYTVKFDTDGGSEIKSVKVGRGKTIQMPAAPTKDGYVFDGWYTDEKLSVNYDFDSKVMKSFTLYAKWLEAEREVNNPGDTSPVINPFADVKDSDWYYDAVMFVSEKGITRGISDTEFAPRDSVTRAQFITMLCRAYDIPEMTGDNFNDSGNTWYTGYLAAAKQLGISNGVGDNKFAPENEITREEMVTLIYNYLKSISEADETIDETLFADRNMISEWAKSAVDFAWSMGYITGRDNNMFDPQGTAVRAELAQIFYNMLAK